VRVPEPTLTGAHVLVVEDEVDSRDATVLVLELCGAQVTAAGSVAEALAAVDRRTPDVIVADIAMPVEDGFELIRRVRAGATRAIPTLALTAFASRADESRILAAGYDAYLAKPIDGTDLVATVQRLVRRAT
jgi:CheY-like chemotaxis protein